MWYMILPRNSAEHDIMIGLISRYLEEIGVGNTIYNNSYGPDVVAYKDGKKIAIEYETGLKDPKETKKMLENRQNRYQEVIMMTKDSCSIMPYSRRTSEAGP